MRLGRKGDGVDKSVTAMFAERKGRDVYVIGSANVGKSTFIRAALKSMRELGNFGVPAKRLPTASAMPGTTLGIIPLRAFEGRGTLYDTPGVFLHHRMNSILPGEDIKRFKLGAAWSGTSPGGGAMTTHRTRRTERISRGSACCGAR